MLPESIRLTVQLDSIRTTKDGGGKIVFEFGSQDMSEIKKLLEYHGKGESNFAMALVKFDNDGEINF